MDEILASINASIEQLDLEYVQHEGNNIKGAQSRERERAYVRPTLFNSTLIKNEPVVE